MLAFRVAATYKDKSGWIDQPATGKEDINNNELSNLRVKGLWQVDEDLEVRASIVRHRSNGGGRNVASLKPLSESNMRVAAVDPLASPSFSDDYDIYNLTINYDLGFASLTSASSYLELDKRNRNLSQWLEFAFLPSLDVDFLGRYFDHEAEAFSQEVRLSGDSGALDWIFGVFYQDFERVLRDSGLDSSIFGNGTPYEVQRLSESLAWFADVTYDLTDRLSISAGTRYFQDDREEQRDVNTPLKNDFENLSSKLALSFSMNDDSNLYLSIAEGFRSGGFNSSNPNSPPSYDEENLISYELGVKAALLEKRLQAEFAIFYSDYTDLQSGTFGFTSSGAVFSIINIAKAEIQGVEMSLQWAVNESFLLGFSGNITDSEVVDVDIPSATATPTYSAGDPLDYVPEYSFSVNADYNFNWSNSVGGFTRLEYNRQGQNSVVNRSSSLAQEEFESEAIGFLNAQIGAEWEQLTLELYGKNLLDEDEATTATISQVFVQSRPRTIGVQLTYDF